MIHPENDFLTGKVVLGIIAAVLFFGVVVALGTGIAIGLLRLAVRAALFLRGLRTCDDCGAKQCPVEIYHDLERDHRGWYTK